MRRTHAWPRLARSSSDAVDEPCDDEREAWRLGDTRTRGSHERRLFSLSGPMVLCQVSAPRSTFRGKACVAAGLCAGEPVVVAEEGGGAEPRGGQGPASPPKQLRLNRPWPAGSSEREAHRQVRQEMA